jgi:hypothetical protein
MYSISRFRTMALVGCAILALTLPRAAYASGNSGGGSDDNGGSGQSEKTESSQSGSGDDHGGSYDGGGDHGDDGGGEDSGDDSGDDGGGNSGSGIQNSGQSSGQNSGSSKSGKVASQDEVLSAVKAGKAVSLPLLLAFMAIKFPGEIVDIKLKNKEGLYSYEVEYLANSSKLSVLKLNAKTLSKL